MLMANSARHPNAASNTPPITGPSPAPTPITDPWSPKALPRVVESVTLRRIACTLGESADANTACAVSGSATSSANVPANIARPEQTPKPATAMMRQPTSADHVRDATSRRLTDQHRHEVDRDQDRRSVPW